MLDGLAWSRDDLDATGPLAKEAVDTTLHLSSGCRPPEGKTSMTTDSDAAAIGALTQRMVAGWASGDADAIADLFVEDGTMVLAGVYCDGKDEIRAYFAAAYQGRYKDTQVIGKPLSIRALAPDVAILLSQGGVLETGESEVSDTNAIRASWLVVKRDGEWLLAAYQNSPRHDAASGGATSQAA